MKYQSIFPKTRRSASIFALFVVTIFTCFASAAAQNSETKQKSTAETISRIRSFAAARHFQTNAALDPCDPVPIAFGQTISGSLANGDCQDPESTQVADIYAFSGTQGQTISSQMSSSQFDTVLVLFDGSGEIIAFNDDADDNTTNSRVPPTGTLTLPFTGQYFLFATSYDETGRGNYSISLSGGAAACTYTLSSSGQNFSASGGTGSFTVTASAPNCAWQAVSNASWLTTSSAGTGSGTVAFTVSANAAAQSRAATISVGGRTFVVTQSALSCSVSISPTTPRFPSTGGQFSITVTASDPSCQTNVSTSTPWLVVQNPTGTGTRTVNLTVAVNDLPARRDGSITIASSTIPVLQGGRVAAYTFDTGFSANIGVFRPNGGLWIYRTNNPNNGSPTGVLNTVAFGLATDKLAPADYDGDGRTDIAVFRDGVWFIIESLTGSFRSVSFGAAGDKPLPADFDGDGKADINVFRPSNGVWYRLNSSNGQFAAVAFGSAEDVPVIADFNADGRSEIAVYRPSNGVWYWLDSRTNAFNAVGFGLATDIPVPMDYDGDGKTDIAVYRPSDNYWYRLNSTDNSLVAIKFGAPGDIPVPAEYDLDGKVDIAVYRPSSGIWYRMLSSRNNQVEAWALGAPGDKPVMAAYQP